MGAVKGVGYIVVGVLATLCVLSPLAMAGGFGVGSGGLQGPGDVPPVAGSTLGPGCVLTATGIYCGTVDAGVLNVEGAGRFGGNLTMDGTKICLNAACTSYLWRSDVNTIQLVNAGTATLVTSASTGTVSNPSTNPGFSSAAASGANAFAATTNGARFDFGAGASDYASSDGTTVTFAGPIAPAGWSTPAATSANLGANGTFNFGTGTSIRMGSASTQVMAINTAPTVTACSGGSAAAVTWSNGTATTRFDVGTACTGESTAVLTFPTTTNCWTCTCFNTAAPTFNIKQSGCATTTATMTNYAATLATVTDWVDGADIQCMCLGG